MWVWVGESVSPFSSARSSSRSISSAPSPVAIVCRQLTDVVKVVVGDGLRAINFSRAPIPYSRESIDDEELFNAFMQSGMARRHIGIYGFRVSGLRDFVSLGESRLERIEKLEQLRWIEAGRDLLVLDVRQRVPGGVDTPEDLAKAQKEFVSS